MKSLEFSIALKAEDSGNCNMNLLVARERVMCSFLQVEIEKHDEE